jgi:hypothetical protein
MQLEQFDDPKCTELKEHQQHGHKKHKVIVEVNGKGHEIEVGVYLVSEFKRLVRVEAAKELDEIVGGEFVRLDDNATISIKGCEQFVGHVRRGGSS